MKYFLFITFLSYILILSAPVSAQENGAENSDSLKKDKVKKGWNFGALPILGYDSDLGFQYGALANVYNYDDGAEYPEYFQMFFFEVSRFTKGSGINQFFFDSKKLIPGIRLTADITYLTEKALNFYGFNGYEAVFKPEWEKDEDTAYKTRVFYRHERQLLRIGADFQGKLFASDFNWFAGLTFLKFETGQVDTARLNKGQKEEKKLPNVPSLYDNYVSWGILEQDEKNGGINNLVKVGLVYDSRDNEPCPMNGIWTEALVAISPGFIGDSKYSFAKLSFIHRQYFTLIKNDLSFAYRLAYQGTIAGEVPFYFQTYMLNTFSQSTTIDGLGGSRTLRGILRNRVVGEGVTYGNVEFRWKFWRFKFIGQNFYTSVSAFADAGMVVQPIKINKSGIPTGIDLGDYFSETQELPHMAMGGSFHIAMNQNFIITIDYGHSMDNRDGKEGFYAGLGYMF